MPEFFSRLFDTDGFPPRRACGYGWAENPGLVWLHVGSDLFIWLAYLSIPLALLVFARRRAAVLPRPITRLLVLFAAFIVFCGFSHFFDAVMFDRPMYRWLGVVKLATAVVSWVTVLTLIPAIPKGVAWLDGVLGRPPAPPPDPADDADARARGYIVALLAAAAAVLARAVFDPLLGVYPAFVIGLLAVVFVSWQCGFKPAVVTLLASMAATVYFFVEPRRSLTVTATSDQLSVAAFVFCGVGCAALGEAQRSARRAAERAAAGLRESEGRFRLLADAMPQMAWVTRPDGFHEFYNARWYEYTGLTEAESLGWGWAGPLHPDDKPRSEALWREATRTGGRYEIEYRFRAADGTYRWFLGRAAPVRDAAGTITRWFGTCTDIDDFKRLQDELKAREADFRAMADSISQLAWMARADGHVFWYNRRWYDYTGTTPEQMEGWGWRAVHDPAVLPEVLERWRATLATGEPFDMTFPLRGADGTFRRFLTRGAPVRDDAGRVVRWFGTNTDVEDQLRYAGQVRASEARFRLLTESIPKIVWSADAAGGLTYVNRRWAEYTGRPVESAAADGWLDAAHPDDREGFAAAWRTALPGHADRFAGQLRVRAADGSYRWFQAVAVPVRRADGAVEQWIGSMTDVHDQKEQAETLERLVADRTAALRAEVEERRRAQAEVNVQREFLDVILENVADGIVACDAGGRLTVFNRASREFHGLTPEPIPKEEWAGRYDLFAADGRTPLAAADVPLVRALRGERVRDAEMVIAPAGQPPRFLLASGQPLTDAGGAKLGAVVSMRDLTERRRLEERERAAALELRRSNAELEQFAYVASHDLQEPLRKIQAFGDRLSTRFREQLGDQGKDYVDRMLSSAGRMRRLIDDLLTFSRVTTKAQPFARVDLAAVAHDALADLDERVRETGGRVEVGDLPAVDADPFQMRQLFLNLIANGLKFRRPGVPPVVTVTGELIDPPDGGGAAARDPWCRVTVSDNGIGFDDKYLPRLFQVFQRLHGRDEYEGTGVGLAICRKIVERHGGAITASGRPGEGAAFVLTFPARHDGGPPADAE